MQDDLLIQTPLYVLTTTTPCWKCKTAQTVTALGCHNLFDGEQDVASSGNDSELVLLTELSRFPPGVLEQVTRRNPLYALRYSNMAETEYYANTCGCGALFGDNYLYSEPGGAFFPEEIETTRAITIEKLEFQGTLSFDCSYAVGSTGLLIFEHATRLDHGHT